MIYYIRNRILYSLKLGLLVFALAVTLPIVFKTPMILSYVVIAVYFLGISARSNWFLLLPYSRKQLIAAHTFEVLVNTAFCFILLSIIELIGLRLNLEDLMPEIKWMICLFPVMGFLSPASQFQKRNATVVQKPISKSRQVISVVVIIVLMFAALATRTIVKIVELPKIITISLLICLAIGVLIAPFYAVNFPRESLKRVQIFLITTCVSIILLLSSSVGALLYFGVPSSIYTELAAESLQPYTFPLSKERMLNLAMEPSGSYLSAIKHLSEEDANSISFESWKTRTLLCKSEDCLNVSDFLTADSLPDIDKIERYRVLMNNCEPKMKANAERFFCSGVVLSSERQRRYRALFTDEVIALNWLESEDELKQYLAIKMLVCQKTSAKVFKKIEFLSSSKNIYVKDVALNHIRLFSDEVKAESVCQKYD